MHTLELLKHLKHPLILLQHPVCLDRRWISVIGTSWLRNIFPLFLAKMFHIYEIVRASPEHGPLQVPSQIIYWIYWALVEPFQNINPSLLKPFFWFICVIWTLDFLFSLYYICFTFILCLQNKQHCKQNVGHLQTLHTVMLFKQYTLNKIQNCISLNKNKMKTRSCCKDPVSPSKKGKCSCISHNVTWIFIVTVVTLFPIFYSEAKTGFQMMHLIFSFNVVNFLFKQVKG